MTARSVTSVTLRQPRAGSPDRQIEDVVIAAAVLDEEALVVA